MPDKDDVVLDADRHTQNVIDLQGVTHTVREYGMLPFRIDETGQTIQMPLRATYTSALGFAFEVGPYSLSREDATALACIISAFRANVPDMGEMQ